MLIYAECAPRADLGDPSAVRPPGIIIKVTDGPNKTISLTHTWPLREPCQLKYFHQGLKYCSHPGLDLFSAFDGRKKKS